ncbi:MAG: c-type cytochrome [Acidobacteria bacterium]|nr:c-type cytochrome [Acidobacteriota bacterium]
MRYARRSVTALALVGYAVAMAALVGCNRPAARPGDPLLDAIRAEERGAGNLTYAESQGRALFAHYCATCHGDEGHGDGQNASNLTPPPPDLTVPKNVSDQALVRKVIAEGSAAVGRSPLSPPWGRSLSRQEIDYLTAYCQALGRKPPK